MDDNDVGCPRLCDLCHKPVELDWDYAWCHQCGEVGVCHHGNRPHDCNDCMIESDLAFDSQRECLATQRKIERPDDD